MKSLQIQEGTSTLYKYFQRRTARLISSGRHMPLPVLSAFMDAVDALDDSNVPEEFWLERMKWLLTKELKTINNVEEKLALIDTRVRESTKQYYDSLDQLN